MKSNAHGRVGVAVVTSRGADNANPWALLLLLRLQTAILLILHWQRIERRTMILPDGRRLIWLEGMLAKYLPDIPEDEDPVAEALEELKRERAKYVEEEPDEFFSLPEQK